jgi:hypothetical protein
MPTANQKTEKYLNEFYAAMYSEEECVDHLIYLTNKNRGLRTTERIIRKYFRNQKIGRLIRVNDPVQFECIKSDKNYDR